MSTGGLDHVCAALALGVTEPGTALISSGTAEVIFVPVAEPLRDAQVGAQGYAQGAHVAGGYYVTGGLYTAGACLEWFRTAAAAGVSYDTLIAEAEEAPPGSLGVVFLPHLRLANPPHDDPRSRGAFLGLNGDVGRGVLLRAVLEGLAFEARGSLEPMLAFIGQPALGTIIATGGITRSRLQMQIRASVLNRTIEAADMDEATALGAAVLAGIGAGVFASAADANARLRYTRTAIDPDPALAALYEHLYHRVYQKLYPAVRDLHHAIYDVQHEVS